MKFFIDEKDRIIPDDENFHHAYGSDYTRA